MSALSALRRRRAARAKRREELGYWRARLEAEGELRNDHYERLYTEHFGLTRADYDGKRILDIGCGPRGSLEWAGMAADRVGVDPLADSYRELGTARHGMTYVSSGAEDLPFEAGRFDFVCALNSLDHVDDPAAALAEMTRVAAADARLLLMVEVNAPPTDAEPHTLRWSVLADLAPGWEVLRERHYAAGPEHLLLLDIDRSVPYDHDDPARPPGWLTALARRR